MRTRQLPCYRIIPREVLHLQLHGLARCFMWTACTWLVDAQAFLEEIPTPPLKYKATRRSKLAQLHSSTPKYTRMPSFTPTRARKCFVSMQIFISIVSEAYRPCSHGAGTRTAGMPKASTSLRSFGPVPAVAGQGLIQEQWRRCTLRKI